MKVWIGIDPGQNGAICFLYDDGTINFVDWEHRVYALMELIEIKKSQSNEIIGCYLEKVHSMPRQGVASTFKFGTNFGWWQGALQALSIGFELISPQAWMKGIVPPRSDKKAIAGIASQIYPNVTLRTPRGALMDGRADALLIAHTCMKENQC